jgi:UrcA family protein
MKVISAQRCRLELEEVGMLSAMLLFWAIGTAAPVVENITIVNGQPAVSVPLAGYDLSNAEDIHRLKRHIGTAARKVCSHAYSDATYLERVACVKGAAEDANIQVRSIRTRGSQAPLSAAIAVSTPRD